MCMPWGACHQLAAPMALPALRETLIKYDTTNARSPSASSGQAPRGPSKPSQIRISLILHEALWCYGGERGVPEGVETGYLCRNLCRDTPACSARRAPACAVIRQTLQRPFLRAPAPACATPAGMSIPQREALPRLISISLGCNKSSIVVNNSEGGIGLAKTGN